MNKKYFNNPFVYILVLFLSIFYFCLPLIAKWISSHTVYVQYATRDAGIIVEAIQQSFVAPFGKWIDQPLRHMLVVPYLLVVFTLIRAIYLHTKVFWKYAILTTLFLLLFLFIFPDTLMILDNDKSSISHPTIRAGKLSNGKRMNYRGDNFTTYSYLGYLFGRTYTNDKVKQIILDAYESSKETCPDITFVLGEIGFKKGGRFLPHRTHTNGLSVDFMTPLLKNGQHYRTNHLFNLWGYGIEFDDTGKIGNLAVDYETMAKHLYAIKLAAKKNGVRIDRIIFDPVLRPFLLKTAYGSKIKDLPFTRNRVIIRHDNHFHVDFGVSRTVK